MWTTRPSDPGRGAGYVDAVFHVMFLEPRIPPNTGNAIRMVAATGATLHLVEPLGFDLSEPKLSGPGWTTTTWRRWWCTPTSTAALSSPALAGSRVFAFTAHATRWHTDVAFEPGDVLLFGPEPTGLPPEVLDHERVTDRLRIPMVAGRRSLNLANSAAVVTYEAWRQQGFPGASGERSTSARLYRRIVLRPNVDAEEGRRVRRRATSTAPGGVRGAGPPARG